MSQSEVTSPAHISYHGLLNQGATCYLNSVLQALFMTKDFKEAVRTCENREDGIDLELKKLFNDLEEDTTSTNNLTKKLGIDRVWEQCDAAQYFEKILQRTSPEASQIFHGGLDNRTTCLTCKKETNSDAPFWYLPLPIGNKDCSVEDGIEEFFKLSEFRGENQMYCERCDAKSDATIGCVMKHPPDVLVLLLKRFDFSYQYMTYIKNNQPVDIPFFLDENIKPLKGSTYELYAVVDHFGDLRSGHYNTNIKLEDDDEHRWLNFDDTRVTLVGETLLQEKTVKSQNAYLLFYRKQTKTKTPDVTNGSFSPNAADNDGQCQDAEESREKEKDGAEERSVTLLVSNNPESDLDRKHGGDEVKETQEHEDKEGNVDDDDLKEKREQPSKESEDHVDAERKPDSDHQVSDRCSECDLLEKQDVRIDARKRRMDADTDQDEPIEAKKGKSVTDDSDRSAEHPRVERSRSDGIEYALKYSRPKHVSKEEVEHVRKTDVEKDTNQKNSANKITSEEINHQISVESLQNLQKEQGDVQLSRPKWTSCFSLLFCCFKTNSSKKREKKVQHTGMKLRIRSNKRKKGKKSQTKQNTGLSGTEEEVVRLQA